MDNNGKIPETVRELYYYLKSEFKRIDSIQAEITEHKNRHWIITPIIVVVVSAYTTALVFILKYLFER